MSKQNTVIADIYNHVQEKNRHPFIMLVGLPASGKSTFVKSCQEVFGVGYANVISTDDYFQTHADNNGVTYQQAFKEVSFDVAERAMWDDFKYSLGKNEPMIVDRTNLSIKSRSKFLTHLRGLEHIYTNIAVVFNPDEETRKKQSDYRFKDTGKIVPSGIVDSMRCHYQFPTKEEGFDKIFSVSYS